MAYIYTTLRDVTRCSTASGTTPTSSPRAALPTARVTEHRPDLTNEGLSTKNVSSDRGAGVDQHPSADRRH